MLEGLSTAHCSLCSRPLLTTGIHKKLHQQVCHCQQPDSHWLSTECFARFTARALCTARRHMLHGGALVLYRAIGDSSDMGHAEHCETPVTTHLAGTWHRRLVPAGAGKPFDDDCQTEHCDNRPAFASCSDFVLCSSVQHGDDVTGCYLHRQKHLGQPRLPAPELSGTADAAVAAVAADCACHWGVMRASAPPAGNQVQGWLSVFR